MMARMILNLERKYMQCSIKTFNHSFIYLTIIPQAWMGSESIAHEAKGRMGYWVFWLRGYEGERNNCLVESNYLVKNIETEQL